MTNCYHAFSFYRRIGDAVSWLTFVGKLSPIEFFEK